MVYPDNGIKNAYVIQVLNSFTMGVIFIVLPLLMVERGINIESMGLIFASLPIVMQSMRTIFAVVSDFIGRKIFYALNGVMNIVFMATYYLSHSPLEFLFGKVTEAMRSAALLSVNRAYFMDHSRDKYSALIKLRGLDAGFSAIGSIFAGFLIALLLYENTIIFCILVSILIFPNLLVLRDRVKRKVDVQTVLRALDIRHKSPRFKRFIWVFIFVGLSWGFMSGYIMPLFLRLTGFAVEHVGLLVGLELLLAGIFAYAFSSLWTGKKLLIVGGICFSISIALLSFSTYAIIPLILAFMGIAHGIANAGYETIFVEVANHTSYAGDIGILMIGMHIGYSASLAISGFIITSIGFPTLFFLAAVLYALFTISAYSNLE